MPQPSHGVLGTASQLEYASRHWKSTFSYSPLVLWWPQLSHFRKKGIFLGLSLVSTSTLKYLWPPSHWKNGRSPWLAPFCCCVRDISYRKLSAHGAAGVPVAWLG